jgi:hypothetical protein
MNLIDEPTDEMLLAGVKSAVDQIYYKGDAWDRGYIDEDHKQDWLNAMRFGWKAMEAVRIRLDGGGNVG